MNTRSIVKTRFAVAALALFVVSALAAGPVSANTFESVNSACDQKYRMPHTTATCLDAAWDNTPPILSGVAGGSTFWAQNMCSDYGSVVASIDTINFLDSRWTLTNSSQERDQLSVYDIRNITCCIDRSDLCIKKQVVATGGQITRVTVTESGYEQTAVDVSTHEKRYEFCEDNADDIYCENDPEGDAFTAPVYDCGADECTTEDCIAFWERSEAYDRCTLNGNIELMRPMVGDTVCYIAAKCGRTEDESHHIPSSLMPAVLDMDDICVASDGTMTLEC